MKKSLVPVITAAIVVSLLFTSCLYGIKGSGKVVKSERQVQMFKSVKVSAGLEVILIQDSLEKVVIEADENLQSIIKTEVSNGELKIYPEKRISSCKAKRIYVTFKNINSAEAGSGAEIASGKELNFSSLRLSVSSGANVKLAVAATRLDVEGSSGASIKLSGSTDNLNVDGSSGANIKVSDLKSKACNASASSGANLKVSASESITARASSGGNIRVGGNPRERNVQKSSGGGVSFD